MKLYTVGFTKTSAESFFGRLAAHGVRSVVDVRLKPDSQLSGFAKKKDLDFFLRELIGSLYRHELVLAPTKEILDAYKQGGMSWDEYADKYTKLIRERQVERTITPESLDGACFLCSEDTPHKCHRRLAAEYLKERWNEKFEIIHL